VQGTLAGGTCLQGYEIHIGDRARISHQRDETINGHVFFSFLVLVFRKELGRRLKENGHNFEWADIKQDLKSLQQVQIEDNGKSLTVRTECLGTCGKVFQSVGGCCVCVRNHPATVAM
jgi:transposase